MRKALLTSTAAIALGMFVFGIDAAHAQGIDANIQDLHNLPVAVTTGGGNATALNKSQDDNTIGSDNSLAATGSGNGVAASSSGGDAFAKQLNGSADTVAPGGLLSNGDLSAENSFNHTQLDVALATSRADGSVDGDIAYHNAASATPDNGSQFTAGINGSTGIITQNVNAGGVSQFNTAVTALGVDNSASLFGR